MLDDEKKFDILLKDLEYRRKKQWDIFSWCSTILLAIIGGMFALATRDRPHSWLPWQRGAISLSAVTVALFAQLWIHYHWKYELEVARALTKAADFPILRKGPPLGYPHVLVALVISALFAIWFA